MRNSGAMGRPEGAGERHGDDRAELGDADEHGQGAEARAARRRSWSPRRRTGRPRRGRLPRAVRVAPSRTSGAAGTRRGARSPPACPPPAATAEARRAGAREATQGDAEPDDQRGDERAARQDEALVGEAEPGRLEEGLEADGDDEAEADPRTEASAPTTRASPTTDRVIWARLAPSERGGGRAGGCVGRRRSRRCC